MNLTDTPTYTHKDFDSDQDIRWCPGCGDYSILRQMKNVLAELAIPKEDLVFISGIGCSSRFPYYLDTFGLHSIHGRAPAFATGLKCTNPNLSIWVITGDGDGLSIGANHLAHTLRRNVDINILLFNNQVYGLTKGQYSPTSPEKTQTKSSPYGSLDYPFNPSTFALGSQATFIARSADRDPKHLQSILKEAEKHQGTSFIEIYQNCNVFNDGAFELYTDKKQKADNIIYLEHQKPMIFGSNKAKGIRIEGFKPVVVDLNSSDHSLDDLWIHDQYDPFKAAVLTHFSDIDNFYKIFPHPFGVLLQTKRPTYNDLMFEQIQKIAKLKQCNDLDRLIQGNQAWEVE